MIVNIAAYVLHIINIVYYLINCELTANGDPK